ncbi:hypothetical protein ATO12_19230 [Aquimarina atlantica]|uniref:Uncharacterized protein n=1 Tax=Aquimarina atlantica TaxID=1317122 RepID=A0A023BT10_9FLAO|nr:hypothetical protein [Aquimarina atlantica]EZH73141.1 hypothetical protein ATO12_19230 [Aquimarina atlantica]
MLQNILNLAGVNQLNKTKQLELKGGLPPECPAAFPTGCFSGPFYCNIYNLPICSPIDLED